MCLLITFNYISPMKLLIKLTCKSCLFANKRRGTVNSASFEIILSEKGLNIRKEKY